MSNYNLELDVRLDNGQYLSGAESVEEANNKLIDSTKKVDESFNDTGESGSRSPLKMAAAWGVVSGAVSAVTQTVIGDMGSLMGQIADATDSTLKFQQTLSFAGVDNSTINTLTSQTQDYANKTVYDLQTIQNTTAQLAANSVPNYEQLTEAAGNLNAVAGGNADTFKSVAMVITQTAGAGKLTTENWNQLANAIPGASGKLQEAMKENGAYTGNFRDAMAAGQITAAEFNQAITQLGMNPAAVQAAESTNTLEGATGNLQASIVTLGQHILSDLLPSLTSLMNWVANNLVPAFESFYEHCRQAWQGVQQWAQKNQFLVSILGGLVAALAGLAVLNTVISWFGVLRAAVSGLWAVMAANPIMLLIGAVAALVSGLIIFFTRTEQGRAIWAAFTNFLRSSFENVKNFLVDAFNIIHSVFNTVFNNIRSVAGTVAGGVRGAWSGITGFFNSIGSSIRNGIINAFNNVRGVASSVAGSVRGAWSGLSGFFSGIGNSIRGAISAGLNGISGLAASAANALIAPFRGAVNGIRGLWNSTIGGKGISIPGWVPGIGGQSWTVPMMATGGQISNSGMAIVGEAGAELIQMPQGAQVTPLNNDLRNQALEALGISKMNNMNNGGMTNVFNIYSNNPDEVANIVISKLNAQYNI